MYKSLIIGIVLSILGIYLVLNSKREGKEVMDYYRNLYRMVGLRGKAKTITKKDEELESTWAFTGGIICLIIGIYGIIAFLYNNFS